MTKFPDVVRARFKAAYKAGLAKMQQYIDNPARTVSFYRRLRVFDPHNIHDMDAPWSSVCHEAHQIDQRNVLSTMMYVVGAKK